MIKSPPPVVTLKLTPEQYALLSRTLHRARTVASYQAEMGASLRSRQEGREQMDRLIDLIRTVRTQAGEDPRSDPESRG